MISVWKYALDDADWQVGLFSLTIPVGGRILDLQMQGGSPVIWALVDSEQMREQRHFLVVGTGHPLTGIVSSRYIGTFQWGSFVGHLFEVFRVAG